MVYRMKFGLGVALGAALTIVSLSGASAQQRETPAAREQIVLSFAPLVREAAPAVVNIFTHKSVEQPNRPSPLFNDPFFRRFFGDAFDNRLPRQRQENSLGSGVIVRPDGLIVTNNHVINEADSIRVVLSDRREFDADILLADERTDLINPCLSVELEPGSPQRLRCIGLIHVVNWRDYIDLQESLTLAFNQLIYRVDLSHFVLSVSYDTTDQQLAAIPALVQGIIDRTPGFELKACRLLVIGEFSYDFKCHLFSEGLSFTEFKDSIDWINRELLRELAEAEIVIPFPTAIEIKG